MRQMRGPHPAKCMASPMCPIGEKVPADDKGNDAHPAGDFIDEPVAIGKAVWPFM